MVGRARGREYRCACRSSINLWRGRGSAHLSAHGRAQWEVARFDRLRSGKESARRRTLGRRAVRGLEGSVSPADSNASSCVEMFSPALKGEDAAGEDAESSFSRRTPAQHTALRCVHGSQHCQRLRQHHGSSRTHLPEGGGPCARLWSIVEAASCSRASSVARLLTQHAQTSTGDRAEGVGPCCAQDGDPRRPGRVQRSRCCSPSTAKRTRASYAQLIQPD